MSPAIPSTEASPRPAATAGRASGRRAEDGLTAGSSRYRIRAKELGSGATLATLASRYGTEVKTTTEFGPAGPVPEIGAAPELVAATFKTPQGQAGPPVPVPNGFVLFRVLTRTEGNRGAAARLLGLKRTTLVEKLRRLSSGREAEVGLAAGE